MAPTPDPFSHVYCKISTIWQNCRKTKKEIPIWSTLRQHLLPKSFISVRVFTGGLKNREKKTIFLKVLKLYHRCRGCLGAGLGVLFHLSKGLTIFFKFAETFAKNGQKIAFFGPWGAPPKWSKTAKKCKRSFRTAPQTKIGTHWNY